MTIEEKLKVIEEMQKDVKSEHQGIYWGNHNECELDASLRICKDRAKEARSIGLTWSGAFSIKCLEFIKEYKLWDEVAAFRKIKNKRKGE